MPQRSQQQGHEDRVRPASRRRPKRQSDPPVRRRQGQPEPEGSSEPTRSGAVLMVLMFVVPLLLLALWAGLSH